LQYLTFDCFLPDDKIDKQALRTKMLDGQFAFQDYAVAKWPQHVNAFINTGKDLLQDPPPDAEEHLLGISRAIEDFLSRYSDEDFGDDIVDECRENCRIFEEEEFYDDLVTVTSHIYTFQKKGFDARHKVSINGLQSVLTRNRKLLEEPLNKLTSAELEKFRQFYDDANRFKCSKITCMYFSEGFDTAKKRKRHVELHERPFRCEVPDCLGAEGFVNSKDLEK
jgi:hypothetical protein